MKLTNQTKLIRRIAEDLRYQPLPDLIDREVVIKQSDSILADLDDALGDSFPAGCQYQFGKPYDHEGTIAKYGLIDVRLLAPSHLLDGCLAGGISLVRELGFIIDDDTEGSEANELFDSDDPTCLQYLADGLDQKQVWIRLFLKDERTGLRPAFKIDEGYFPHQFKIENACVTNSPFVWFHRYFYL